MLNVVPVGFYVLNEFLTNKMLLKRNMNVESMSCGLVTS